jgi:hypothetical protein
VTRFGPDGGVQAIFRAAVPRLPITPDLMEIVRDSYAVRATRSQVASSPEAFLAALAKFDIPDSISAIGAMHTDTEGNLWVLRGTSGYQPDEPQADVLDPDGTWLGTVRLPDGIVRVLSIGSERLIALWRDPLDVPYIRVHRIQKPEDSAGDRDRRLPVRRAALAPGREPLSAHAGSRLRGRRRRTHRRAGPRDPVGCRRPAHSAERETRDPRLV